MECASPPVAATLSGSKGTCHAQQGSFEYLALTSCLLHLGTGALEAACFETSVPYKYRTRDNSVPARMVAIQFYFWWLGAAKSAL